MFLSHFLIMKTSMWGVPNKSWGYPESFSMLFWDFPWNKPSSELGVPLFLWNPPVWGFSSMTLYQMLFTDRHPELTAVEVLEGWSWDPTEPGSLQEESERPSQPGGWTENGRTDVPDRSTTDKQAVQNRSRVTPPDQPGHSSWMVQGGAPES